MAPSSSHVAGLLFVACMFIGAGIGLLFDRPDVGGAIGMGIGFVALALAKGVRVKRVEVSIPRSLPFAILLTVGALLIASGVTMLIAPKLVYPYLTGMALIVLGILAILGGMVVFKKA